MPIGLTDAPAVRQNDTDSFFTHHWGSVYQDDNLVFSRSHEEHMQDTDESLDW